MHPWPPPCYQRATAFVTDPDGRLLVFDHVDVLGHAFQAERWIDDQGRIVVRHVIDLA